MTIFETWVVFIGILGLLFGASMIHRMLNVLEADVKQDSIIETIRKDEQSMKPLTRDELLKTLNFLLQMGIINTQEHTRLLTKALPYTKG